MSGSQYQTQLEALKELDAYLQRIIPDVQNIMRGYAAKVSELLDRGLPLEVHDKVMTEFYMQSQNLATQSCAIISDQAIPHVRHHIQGLEQLIGR
jgi:hypothetical protein